MPYRQIAVVLALTVVGGGCDQQDPAADIDTVSVEGTLKIDGKNFGPAKILLKPEPTTRDSMGVEGDIDKNGAFTLRLRGSVDGAPEGKYKVQVTEDTMTGKSVPYFKTKIIEIKKPADGGTLKLVIDLTSTKKGGTGDPAGTGKRKGPGGT